MVDRDYRARRNATLEATQPLFVCNVFSGDHFGPIMTDRRCPQQPSSWDHLRQGAWVHPNWISKSVDGWWPPRGCWWSRWLALQALTKRFKSTGGFGKLDQDCIETLVARLCGTVTYHELLTWVTSSSFCSVFKLAFLSRQSKVRIYLYAVNVVSTLLFLSPSNRSFLRSPNECVSYRRMSYVCATVCVCVYVCQSYWSSVDMLACWPVGRSFVHPTGWL